MPRSGRCAANLELLQRRPGLGLYKSADGGLHLDSGSKVMACRRASWAASGCRWPAAAPGACLRLIEANEGGLFRSDDGGEKWTRVNEDHRFRQRAWYFSHVIADPVSPEIVYVLNTGAYRSTDGGKTFELMPAPHGDHHALWIDPKSPRRLINGNDGGATISLDSGATWTALYNQPTAQFYHVAVDNGFPYRIYGAQQDNTTIAIEQPRR